MLLQLRRDHKTSFMQSCRNDQDWAFPRPLVYLRIFHNKHSMDHIGLRPFVDYPADLLLLWLEISKLVIFLSKTSASTRLDLSQEVYL